MIPGYNHSVMHRGTVYHVQTEDSGLQNPIVSTHLFLGGNVVASRRTSYAEIASAADAEERVRKLMQQQHKEMLRQLIRGEYDGDGSAAAGRAYQPGELAAGPVGAATPPIAPGPKPAPAAHPVSAAAGAAQRSPAPASVRVVAAEGEPPVLPRVSQPAPVLIPEIEDEDLLSDRRLDEVILAYLAEAPGMKSGH